MSGDPTVATIENWLETKTYGYAQLGHDDRQAVLQFTLLWSLFEANMCNANASVRMFRQEIGNWDATGLQKRGDFSSSFAHFRDRYCNGGAFTAHFTALNFRPPDREVDVKAVLRGDDQRPEAEVVALLTIIYRLRNNLFHGPKWADRIKGQTPNFTHANKALIALLEQAGGF